MSRNLASQCCYFCGLDSEEFTFEEEPRLITKEDAGAYLDEYGKMMVAHVHCPNCKAKYTAWCSGGFLDQHDWHGDGLKIRDMSFRSTWNDEPGEDDMPEFVIKTINVHMRYPVVDKKLPKFNYNSINSWDFDDTGKVLEDLLLEILETLEKDNQNDN